MVLAKKNTYNPLCREMKMADGRWPMADGQWPIADGRWTRADGRQQTLVYDREKDERHDDDDDDYDDGDVCQDDKGWSDKSDHKQTKRPQNYED